MSRIAEAADNIRVALKLAMFNGPAAEQCPNDGDVAWRSFAALPFAMILQTVAAAATLQIVPAVQAAAEAEGGSGFAGPLWFVTSWLIAVTIGVEGARHLKRVDVIPRYVTLFNWAAAIQAAAIAFVLTAFASAPQVSLFLAMIIGFWSLLYDWFLAKTVLRIPGGPAALIVVLQKGSALILVKMLAG